MEKSTLDFHLKDCKKRDKYCNFCNLNIKFDDYSSHVYSCSSRSELCPYCNKYIVLRDFEYHTETIHNDVTFEGEKIFNNTIDGLLKYQLDFTEKNKFLKDKMRKSFKSEGFGVRGALNELIQNLQPEEECEVLSNENNIKENSKKEVFCAKEIHQELKISDMKEKNHTKEIHQEIKISEMNGIERCDKNGLIKGLEEILKKKKGSESKLQRI